MPDPTVSVATGPPESSTGGSPEVVAKHPEFARLEHRAGTSTGTSLDSLRDVPITITARLGHTILPIGDILKLGPGSVIELEEAVGQPIELTVRGVPFATGEVVVVDDHFAIRIKTLLPPRAGKGEM
jgi:flagellar motor switch protein FliN/FliY